MRPLSDAQRAGCRQNEAFCLMLYRDESGTEEWIWNSRDAVTPFCLTLRNGNEARHVEWHRDHFDPWHEPKVGDRIFVNLTMERARSRRRAFVDRWWNDGEYKMSARYASKDEAIEKLAQHDFAEFGAGTTPDLIEVTEAVIADLRSRRPPRPRTWMPPPRTYA